MADAGELEELLVANRGERQAAASLSGIRADHRGRYRWAAGFVRNRDWVLDAACGVGYGSRLIAQATHCTRVVGIDNAEPAIRFAKQHYSHPRVNYVLGSVYELPMEAETYDVIVSLETIEHVDDTAALKEFARVLRPGGVLLASTPNEDVLPYNAGYTHHRRHYRPREFADLVEAAGFRLIAAASNVAIHAERVQMKWGGPFSLVAAQRVA